MKGNKMRAKQKRFDLRLFLSLFLPYLVIILVIGGINLFVAVNAMNSLEKDAVNNGLEKAETINAQIARELYENLPVLASLENSYQVKDLLETSKDGSPDFSMASYYFQKEMVQKLSNANYLAAYLPERQYVVTTQHGYDSSTIPLFLNSTEITREELDSFLAQKYSTRFINSKHSWITSRNVFSDGSQVLMIADYNLIGVIRGKLQDEDLFAVGMDGQVVYANHQELKNISYDTFFAVSDGQMLKINGSEYIQVRVNLPFSDLKLALAMPLGTLGAELNGFRRITVWAILGALLFSFFVSLSRSGKIYNSLRELAQASGKERKASTVLDVIQDTGEHITHLNKENFQIHQEISEVSPVVLGKALLRLSTESEASGRERALSALKMCRIDPEKPVAMFGLGVLEDDNDLFQEREEDHFGKNGIEFFILDNFLRDLLFEEHGGAMANMDGYYLVLANVENGAEPVSRAAEEMETACRQFLHVTVVTTPVFCASRPEELDSCVRHAQDSIIRNLFWGNEEGWSEVPEKNYQSYIENIRNLVNALTVKNYNEAQTILDSIIALELPGDEKDIHKAIYRMYGTIGIITALIESQTGVSRENAGEIDYGGKLYKVKNVREFREESKRILSELIKFKEQYQKNVIPDIVLDAKNYVDEHYADSGLNVTAVADALGVGDSYLTRIFRTYMETNLLEYIQRKRVEKAKELLKTQNVKDAANMVGLWDAQAMIRLFRKYEGMTPGAYKDLLAQKEKENKKESEE